MFQFQIGICFRLVKYIGSEKMGVVKYRIQYQENGVLHNRQIYTFDISTYLKNWLARVKTIQIVKCEQM